MRQSSRRSTWYSWWFTAEILELVSDKPGMEYTESDLESESKSLTSAVYRLLVTVAVAVAVAVLALLALGCIAVLIDNLLPGTTEL